MNETNGPDVSLPPLTLHKMLIDDVMPSEFRWHGRVFSLYGGETLAELDTITIVYNDGGSKLEDETDEDLCAIITAWARWARHNRRMLAGAALSSLPQLQQTLMQGRLTHEQ